MVSFKSKDCVVDTIDEIELVKNNLMSDKKIVKLGIADWKVQAAYAPTDIVWSEINYLTSENGWLKEAIIIGINIVCSLTLYFVLNHFDRDDFTSNMYLRMLMKYLCPTIFTFYVLYANPWLVFQLI